MDLLNVPRRIGDLTPPDCFLQKYLKVIAYTKKPTTINILEANTVCVIDDNRS